MIQQRPRSCTPAATALVLLTAGAAGFLTPGNVGVFVRELAGLAVALQKGL